jgi:uncharacterized membrane protein YkvA (DUF1232 family)
MAAPHAVVRMKRRGAPMSLRITFELEEKDLKFFRTQMNRAKKQAKEASEAEVLTKARKALEEARKSAVPMFVKERIEKIDALTRMLDDADWNLEGEERRNVISALSYFAEPEDIIPDHIPVLGFIDDAIMIELVVRELTHEIDAYTDFCNYRKTAPKGKDSRAEWLEAKRRLLFSRMRRRRQRSYSGSSGRLRLF